MGTNNRIQRNFENEVLGNEMRNKKKKRKMYDELKIYEKDKWSWRSTEEATWLG